MKASKIIVSLICTVLLTGFVHQAAAQFMPVVYDNNYGRDNAFTLACADFQNGDVVIAGTSSGSISLTWLDREGEARFTKRFTSNEFSEITKIISVSEDQVLVIGRSIYAPRERNSDAATGRAMVINSKGVAERMISVGENGTLLTAGQLLSTGVLILAGSTPSGGGDAGFICKVSANNRVLYSYVAGVGERCTWFSVQGSLTEYIDVAFSAVTKPGSSVVRLDDNGKPYFITALPDPSFKIEKMISGEDGFVYLVGEGNEAGGAIIKIRPEGDIVFQKQIVKTGMSSKLNQLLLISNGNMLVGGNDSGNAYYLVLRNDGTELSRNIDNGYISAIANDSHSGDCVVSIFDSAANRGKIVKISKLGRRLYEKATAADYSSLHINGNGDVLMGSASIGRLSMVSSLGELLFDRYIIENTPTKFTQVYLPFTGEALFMGSDGRMAKLAHGLYVDDIDVVKPINGQISAVFTVTLSGYSFTKEGAAMPVTVAYKTAPGTASEGLNFNSVSGTLSFIPLTDGSNQYLSKFTVEVPVNANDLLEGNRNFTLQLSDVNQSYLIKPTSRATIEDQPAIVKMISTTPGIEGQSEVIYELGIFKRNGVKLTNATNSDIVIDGSYGTGTADRLDYDMGRLPRLIINNRSHSGTFRATTLEDTRYEAVKTLVVNFDKISAMSDTNVSFGSNLLSCTGEIFDQAATVAIESLGNHTTHNNVMTGLFKVTLLRAHDGALQTNNSGSDIVLTTSVNDKSTGKRGQHFVISNDHDLRISSDGRSSAVNILGLILYSEDPGQKSVVMDLTGVKAGAAAGPISVSNKNNAQFLIR
jgi:Calx-beta domain.